MNSAFKYKLDFYANLNRLLLVGVALIFFSSNLFAGNLTLAWNPSSSTSVAGYTIYYGTASNTYTGSVDAGNLTTYQVTGLTAGITYFFAVKAYNAGKTVESSFSNEISGTVPATSTLSANFTANTTSGTSPLIVSFTPSITGTVTGYSWDFGDPAIPVSASQNPTVTYSIPGTYTVSLTVTGAGTSATASKPNFITVAASPTPPVANFSATPTSGAGPLTVGFTDTSTGNVTTWLWSFGDGATSTVKNPTHIYNSVGSYPVSLTVTGSGGSNTKTSAGFINVSSTVGSNNTGLMAAYSFDENGQTIVADASGMGNHGLIKEAARVATGRFGKALKFDGVNDWVTVKNNASLGLSKQFTIEAWVYPQAIHVSSILFKEQVGGAVYDLYAYHDADLPMASFFDNTNYQNISGTTQLPINKWAHLVSTYDGINERLYINGIQVSIRAQTGLIRQSSGSLRIGGDSIWGEYFQGYIDEVRIYNRALTSAEIIKDETTAVSVSNPPKQVIGNKTLEASVDSNPQGMAEAFKTVSQNNGVTTAILVYLDASSTATELVAGLYADANGHPGVLLAQGKLSTLKSGATNVVPIPAVALGAAKPYWIAILGTKGQIKFRDRAGSGVAPMETSAGTALTTLPGQWVTGSVYPTDGPMSVYGIGY